MSNTVFHAANTRGHANHGWLDTYHTFSFASYHEPSRVHFGAIRVINDDIVKGGFGFGKHPHDNMEIITIVLDGALEHKDSMGHTQAILPNEVQVMSAGTGIFHSEYNHNKDKDVNLFQIWIFPDKHNVHPRYDQKKFEPSERINKLQTLVSPIYNKEDGSLQIHQMAWIHRTNLQAGHSLDYKMKGEGNGLYILMVDGSLNANGQQLGKRDGFGISSVTDVMLKADADSDVILLEVPMQ